MFEAILRERQGGAVYALYIEAAGQTICVGVYYDRERAYKALAELKEAARKIMEI